jgi:hypothetical protein
MRVESMSECCSCSDRDNEAPSVRSALACGGLQSGPFRCGRVALHPLVVNPLAQVLFPKAFWPGWTGTDAQTSMQ